MAEALMTYGVPGPKGATGARGPTGATGPQGPQGPAGASASYSIIGGFPRNSSSLITVNGVKFAILLAHDDFTALYAVVRGTTRYYYRTGAMMPISAYTVVGTSSSNKPYNGYTTVILTSTGTMTIERSSDSNVAHISSFIAFT